MKKIKLYLNKLPKGFYLGLLMCAIFTILLGIATSGFNSRKAPYNNIAFSIFGLDIAWYALFIVTGLIFGFLLCFHEFKIKSNNTKPYNLDFILDGLLIIATLCIINLRLFYVLFDPNAHYNNIWEVLNFRDGGLAISGAIITVLIATPIFCYFKKVNIWLIFDIILPCILLGQVIGRFGNFMNQEAYGPIITDTGLFSILPAFIKQQMLVSGSYRLPTFLLEAFFNLLCFIFIIIVRRFKLLKVGDIASIYLVFYGLLRGLIIEPLRTDQLLFLNIPINVLIPLALYLPLGIAIFIFKRVFYKSENKYYYEINESNILLPILRK
jgi:phosphatidylglycerol:prolipoprotein diacylglycerol transferase